MKLTKNQQMLLGAAALVAVGVYLYRRNKNGNGGNGNGTSSFGGRMLGGTALKNTRIGAANKICNCRFRDRNGNIYYGNTSCPCPPLRGGGIK